MMTATQFEVAVVGAGVLGSSVASHLAAGGMTSVALIDAGKPASGTSNAGAGFVGTWAAGYMAAIGEAEIALEEYGLSFYRELHKYSDIQFKNFGSLFTAVTEEGVSSIDAIVEHPLAPVGTRRLSAAETSEITKGLLNPAKVVESAIHPSGIQISAGDATRALAAKAAAAGVTVIAETKIEVIEAIAGGYALRSGETVIKARKLVVAAGAWTNELLAPLQAEVPLLREIASRVVSPPSGVPSAIPTLMIRDWGLWLREEKGGLTWASGKYSYAPLREFANEVPLGSRPRFEALIQNMEDPFLPELQQLIPHHDLSTGEWLQGLPCYTPDGLFIAGEVAHHPDLYVLAGDNEAGVTHGPGLGRALAERILQRETFGVDIDRYSPQRFGSTRWTEEEVLDALPRFK